MNYSEAIAYMDSKVVFGIRPGLERITALCNRLGNPQNSFPSIHVAGTNGKTSTARITSAVISEHGFKTGTYTSPHLVSYTERFLIDSERISEDLFADALCRIIPSVEKVNRYSEEPLTHFEILTALGFLIFAEEKLDCAVIETGMGGRWDATSIITPRVAVITNVDLEHTEILGDTVAKIAWEKAHIIKNGCKALAGNLNAEALAVVEERCEGERAQLKRLGRDFALLAVGNVGLEGQIVSVRGLFAEYESLFLPLVGGHQGENAALSLAIAESFVEGPLGPEEARAAFAEVRSPGRFEIVSRDPLIILDGAHNPAGMSKLAATLAEFGGEQVILVVAILEDKNAEQMLETIIPHAGQVIVTQNHSERCLPADQLGAIAGRYRADCAIEKDLLKALEIAIAQTKETGHKGTPILVTGSLYTVGESRDYLETRFGSHPSETNRS